MWLVLASDLMFFVGLLGAFIVLRTGNIELFSDHLRGLNIRLAGAGVLILIVSSSMMFIVVRTARYDSARKCRIALAATLLCGGVFTALRSVEYFNALHHHTILARQSVADPLLLFDGQVEWLNGQRVLLGYAAALPSDFESHMISEQDAARLSGAGNVKTFTLPPEIFQDIPYGPGKNIFYTAWFTLTGAHLVHLMAGMIAMVVLLVQSLRRKLLPIHAECVGLLWHFAVFIGIVLFPILYF